jgi:hypothetical protein
VTSGRARSVFPWKKSELIARDVEAHEGRDFSRLLWSAYDSGPTSREILLGSLHGELAYATVRNCPGSEAETLI